MDEFTSALDKALEDNLLDDIFAIFDRQTIICITHSENVAKRFERVIRLMGAAQLTAVPDNKQQESGTVD